MLQFFSSLPVLDQKYLIRLTTGVRREDYGADLEIQPEFCTSLDDLFSELEQSDRDHYVFHAIFDPRLALRLGNWRSIGKSSWIVWGQDLYSATEMGGLDFVRRIFNKLIRRRLARRIGQVAVLTPGDGETLALVTGRDQHVYLPYPLIDETSSGPYRSTKQRRSLRILVGNSGARSNRHHDAFGLLEKWASEDIEVIVPLGYGGDDAYVDSVIASGSGLFAGRFYPIRETMPKADYVKLLSGIDVGIFLSRRQQGLFAIYFLLGQGKKVYLSRESSSFSNLRSIGFHLNSAESLGDQFLAELGRVTTEEAEANMRLLSEHFTTAALAPRWTAFLNGDCQKTLYSSPERHLTRAVRQ